MLCLQLTYIVHLAKCCFCGDYSVISYFCIWSGLQSYKEYVRKSICEQEHMDIVRNSCPAAGACGGMYTANTMASDCHWSSWHVPSCTGTYIPSAIFIFFNDEILDCLLCNNWILQEMMKQCSCFRSEVCKCWTNSSSPFTLLPTRDVRDDRQYRRKNKREEHMRSIDQSVFLQKKKIGLRVQSYC